MTNQVRNKIWNRNRVIPPIDKSSIPNFKEWLVYSSHSSPKAFDYVAYRTKEGNLVLGLPLLTPVYAIASGIVEAVIESEYESFISILHGRHDLSSVYGHVNPLTHPGDKVKQGQKIALLGSWKIDGYNSLIHLHLELYNSLELLPHFPSLELITNSAINPEEILFKRKLHSWKKSKGKKIVPKDIHPLHFF